MAGQWKRSYDGRHVVIDRDNAGVGNGDDVWGTSVTDIECRSVAILSGDLQFHEHGCFGNLWSEFDHGEWSGDDHRPAGAGNRRTVATDTRTDFDSRNAHADLYADEYAYQYTNEHADEHTNQYAD